jgi:hypothetical protein
VQPLARERSAGAECNGRVGSLNHKPVTRDLGSRGPVSGHSQISASGHSEISVSGHPQISPGLMFGPPFLAPVRAPLPPAPPDTLVSDWMRIGATCEREWGGDTHTRGPRPRPTQEGGAGAGGGAAGAGAIAEAGAGGRGPFLLGGPREEPLGHPREEPSNGAASSNYLLLRTGQATNFPTNLM